MIHTVLVQSNCRGGAGEGGDGIFEICEVGVFVEDMTARFLSGVLDVTIEAKGDSPSVVGFAVEDGGIGVGEHEVSFGYNVLDGIFWLRFRPIEVAEIDDGVGGSGSPSFHGCIDMDSGVTVACNNGCNVCKQSGHVVSNDTALVVGVVVDVAAREGAGHVFGVGVPVEIDLVSDIIDFCGAFVEPHTLLVVVGEVVGLLNRDTDGI